MAKDVFYAVPEFIASSEDGLTHGFFTRRGGVSTGIYDSLNCGAGSDDNPDHVMQNKSIVAQAMKCAQENLVTLHQVHSAECVTVTQPWNVSDRPKADAMVTNVPDLALGVLTADCAPVLFTGNGPEGHVIGAAHAGWGGALRGVLGETVEAMQRLGAQQETIRACVGPCIGKASYEVSEDFVVPFLQQDEDNEHFFHAASREGHLMFDLAGYCAKRLSEAGVRHVHILDQDTYSNEDDFFSYRRTTHRGEPDYGRQISVIKMHKSN